jgi:hypothetical protein
MTDVRHELTGLMELTRELEYLRHAPETIGSESARDDETVEVPFRGVTDTSVRAAGIAMLAGVQPPGFHAGDYDSRTGLDEPQFRIPELEILVDVVNEHQETPRLEWVCEGHASSLPSTDRASKEDGSNWKWVIG